MNRKKHAPLKSPIFLGYGIAIVACKLAATIRIEIVAVPEPVVPVLLFL
uniref:Uncharacterized protein n=1 Tax=Candidatus Methanophagaceae archaeon ANME-1 ERB6 TaxID=2759912 RepID=A0A7G9YSJ3_9EURY|nr:hypothetical protein LCGFKGIO_00010 [Methanosarcinales archaeon ANME-1 ERB6]